MPSVGSSKKTKQKNPQKTHNTTKDKVMLTKKNNNKNKQQPKNK
jgi:hypothetical protein